MAADNGSRTEGDRFPPSVPPRAEPYPLKGCGGAGLGHAEPAGPGVPARHRPHRDAGHRPRLLPGPDHRAGAGRPVHRAAAALRRRADDHPRHGPVHDPAALRRAGRAAGQRRPEHPARSCPTSRSRSAWRTPSGSTPAAVAVQVFIGGELETQSVHNMTRLVDQGQRYGVPVLAVTAVGRELTRDARYLRLATRICAELGAHVVKTYYCAEDFDTVTAACPVPVVMAGGKKLPELDALTMAYRAIAEGAAGVDMGRNIFQSDNPAAMIQAVGAIVHQSRQAAGRLRPVPAPAAQQRQRRRTDEHPARAGHPGRVRQDLRGGQELGPLGRRRRARHDELHHPGDRPGRGRAGPLGAPGDDGDPDEHRGRAGQPEPGHPPRGPGPRHRHRLRR